MAAPQRAAPQRHAAPPRAAPAPRAAGRPAPEWRPRAAERRQQRIEQRQQRIEQRALRRQERIERREAQRPGRAEPQDRAARAVQTQQSRAAQRQQERQLQQQERRELRQLQAKQRQELRGRNLSRGERRELRAQQRQQVQNLRAEQRENRRQALQRQQAVDQNAVARDQRRLDRRKERIEAAREGRFAARFHNRADRREARLARAAARHAWRRGKRAAFVAWFGPVFYPYAYSDIFEYTYWPYAYDEAYWAYVYDDFFDGVFWGYGNPYVEYETASIPGTTGSAPPSPRRALPRGTTRSAAQLCAEPGKGITAWPFTQIEQAVKPDGEQKRLLEELKHAAADAAAAFKASCDEDIALTPTGRLAAMTRRVEATLHAVRIVRPALDAFYNSLSDEQKARFTAIGPEELAADERKRVLREPQPDAKGCGDAKPGLVDLPIAEIEEAIRPSDAQREKLDKLSLATSSAVELLQAACPDPIPLTPSGRLEVMEKRLDALLQAARTVQPALSEFYASLSNEQKAQFNTLGQQAQRAN
ncbi:MAG: Spy/CpxP family protein refolding chaperone [Pseudorhodoplanes sp.]|nr:Spy/CpxP family protein refolding chaperone [Pseudorhodoplanes sp.]